MVFYFTGTGNCLYVAKEIRRRVEGCDDAFGSTF